jgi:hypothetical protein
MAFIDAIELASDAGAADAIGATAGDLATVAPAIEGSLAGPIASLRTAVGHDLPGSALPIIFDPFPGNAILTAMVVGALVLGGIVLTEAGLEGIFVLGILFGGLALLTKLTTGK